MCVLGGGGEEGAVHVQLYMYIYMYMYVCMHVFKRQRLKSNLNNFGPIKHVYYRYCIVGEMI